MNSVLYLKPIGFVSSLPSQFHLFTLLGTRRDSQGSRECAQRNYLATALLNCCSVGNVTSCHEGSWNWICCQGASEIGGWVYYGRTLQSWSIIRLAVALSRHHCGVPARHLHYILRGLEAANSGQTSVDELLLIIAGFGSRTQEGLKNSSQGAVDSSGICRLIAEARRLCERIGDTDAHCHHLRIVIICAFSFVQRKTRWTLRNRNSVPLPLNITVW